MLRPLAVAGCGCSRSRKIYFVRVVGQHETPSAAAAASLAASRAHHRRCPEATTASTTAAAAAANTVAIIAYASTISKRIEPRAN